MRWSKASEPLGLKSHCSFRGKPGNALFQPCRWHDLEPPHPNPLLEGLEGEGELSSDGPEIQSRNPHKRPMPPKAAKRFGVISIVAVPDIYGIIGLLSRHWRLFIEILEW